MTPPAVLVREGTWNVRQAVFELVGEVSIGGLVDDVNVGAEGPLAKLAWDDRAWRIQPCSPAVLIDDVPLVGELSLRHGQAITSINPRGWKLRFLAADRDRALEELRHYEAVTDCMTGMLDRRIAYRVLERMTTGVVMLIDIDWLKCVNDQYGMMAGDAVIKRTAKLVRDRVAWPNLAARYGGEELVVLMPGSTLDDARVLAEEIRAAAEPPFVFEGEPLTAPVSIGLAIHAGEGTPALRAADEAMAQAKQQGRNRVVG